VREGMSFLKDSYPAYLLGATRLEPKKCRMGNASIRESTLSLGSTLIKQQKSLGDSITTTLSYVLKIGKLCFNFYTLVHLGH
jgi:hypothetical protein